MAGSGAGPGGVSVHFWAQRAQLAAGLLWQTNYSEKGELWRCSVELGSQFYWSDSCFLDNRYKIISEAIVYSGFGIYNGVRCRWSSLLPLRQNEVFCLVIKSLQRGSQKHSHACCYFSGVVLVGEGHSLLCCKELHLNIAFSFQKANSRNYQTLSPGIHLIVSLSRTTVDKEALKPGRRYFPDFTNIHCFKSYWSGDPCSALYLCLFLSFSSKWYFVIMSFTI